MTSLFPKHEIYVSLLPPEARNMIGKVGSETEPARMLLERIGFKYLNHIDPFDGGPYLEAVTDQIVPVKATITGTLVKPVKDYPKSGYVSVHHKADFRALRTSYAQSRDGISVTQEVADVLKANLGDNVAVTPLPLGEGDKVPPDLQVQTRKKNKSQNKKSKTGKRRAATAPPPEAVP
jgi:arginine N-succinyltransferase